MSRFPTGDIGPGQIARFNGIHFVGLNIGSGLSVSGNTLTAAGIGGVGPTGPQGEQGEQGDPGPTGATGPAGAGGSGDSVLTWLNL
jgi:hypothetical protein